MEENYDKNKTLGCLFDPATSQILAELENENKDLILLGKKFNMSKDEVIKQLSYLIQHKFVTIKSANGKTEVSLDKDKVSKIIETSTNFDSAIDGLTKLDSYLN